MSPNIEIYTFHPFDFNTFHTMILLVNRMEPIVISIHNVGKERGTRIYFNSKDIKKIKEKFGENFFLFTNKKLLAYIDPINENIRITALENKAVQSRSEIDSDMIVDYTGHQLNLKEIGRDEIDFDMDDSRLHFYLPIEGTGDKYQIAEVNIKDNLAYYCVASSLSSLKKEIHKKGNKYFPGLLDSRNVKINYLTDYLVHSPVPGFIAKRAFDKIACKKICNVEIPSNISIPNDADLTPLIDMGKGSIKDLKILKRTVLANYEINAIASQFAVVKNTTIKEINDEILWEVTTNKETLYFNPITGEKIEEINEFKVD